MIFDLLASPPGPRVAGTQKILPLCVPFTGLPRSGKKFWKMFREKSGNFFFSQGNLEKMKKVMEKSGNFKNLKKLQLTGFWFSINCKQY